MGFLGWTVAALGLAALAHSDRNRISRIHGKCSRCGQNDAGYTIVANGHSTYVAQFRCSRCGRTWRKKYGK